MTARDRFEQLRNVRESKVVEYKREMPASTAPERVKLLAAVSSFANTSGGDLYIGIDEAEGLPVSMPGIALDDADSEKRRLLDIIKDNIEPRVPGIEVNDLPIEKGRFLIHIKVLRSWNAPHRVKLDNKFYGRTSAGKYPLDTNELRQAFLMGENTAGRVRAFRDGRLIKIVCGETPVGLTRTSCMVVHVVALHGMPHLAVPDIVEVLASGSVMPLPFGRRDPTNKYLFNLDGCVTYVGHDTAASPGYSQIFRTGALEGVGCLEADDGQPYLHGPTFEKEMISTVENFLAVLTNLLVPPPFAVLCSLTNIRGSTLRYRSGNGVIYSAGPLREDVIALPEIIITDLDQSISGLLDSTFSALWNAFGLRKQFAMRQ